MGSATNNSVPEPFVFLPSDNWDGDDGSWSTFSIRVGWPEQDFRILPATSRSWTHVPVGGCIEEADPPYCGNTRGVYPFDGKNSTGFLSNSSWTWQNLSTSTLDPGVDSDTAYGRDAVGLGLQSSSGLTLKDQVVGLVWPKNFYLGSLGLAIAPISISNSTHQEASFMRTLKNKNMIPSASFAYTAGAPYRIPPTPGSLTIGGHDASRFTANTKTFDIDKSQPNNLTINLQKVTAYNTLLGTRDLVTTSIPVHIDSGISQLFLPEEACDNFASAFGLNYDNSTDLYLVNDTVRERLRESKPTIHFSIAPQSNPRSASDDPDSDTALTIKFPHGAFDLEASWPLRAPDKGPFILGRVFLQETYLIVDWERANFSVHQALFTDPMPASDIVTIASPQREDAPKNDTSPASAQHGTFSASAKLGVAVGLAVFALILCLALFFFLRHRRMKRSREVQGVEPSDAQLSGGAEKHELYGAVPEMLGSKGGVEVDAVQERYLASDDALRRGYGPGVHELEAGEEGGWARELEGRLLG
ncbi:hypothetical protein N0V90_008044 [Kalmusia sp. IMI 367209]|nr:hypothetical protein N0V90_008044 [Kalmusia sp. IMI 367209]